MFLVHHPLPHRCCVDEAARTANSRILQIDSTESINLIDLTDVFGASSTPTSLLRGRSRPYCTQQDITSPAELNGYFWCIIYLHINAAWTVWTPRGCAYCMSGVGQNRIYALYITVYLVISLPKIPCIHRMYMVMANPKYEQKATLCLLKCQGCTSLEF